MGRAKSSEAGALVLKRGGRRDRGGGGHNKTGFDGLSKAPWRKLPCIYVQPVTLVRTTSRSAAATPAKLDDHVKRAGRHPVDKLPSIFWAKSLEGLKAVVPMNLADRTRPENLRPIIEDGVEPCVDVSILSNEAACATLCAALLLNGSGEEPRHIVGQTEPRAKIADAPFAHIKFTQPLVSQLPNITEQDIAAQERRVLDARKRLQELRRSFMIR